MRSTAAFLLIMIFLAASIPTLPITVNADPATIVVPDDARTITAALQLASDGDTILVKRGTYQEQQLIINKTISLIGEDPDNTKIVLTPPVGPYGPLGTWGIDYPVKIEANNVTLSGFTIAASGERPVLLGNGGNVLAIGSETKITGNIIETGITAIGDNIRITNNSIHDTSCSNYASLSVYGSHQVIIENTVSGIWVENSMGNIISRNNVFGTRGPGVPVSEAGIQLRSATRNQIISNNITCNGPCIVIDCYVGTEGLQTCKSERNVLYQNHFISNSTHVSQVGYGTGDYSVSNTWHRNSLGNYWSDYEGTDADGDGIGDTPYIIDENNQDNYPLVIPVETYPSPYPSPEPSPSPEPQSETQSSPTTLIYVSVITVVAIVGLSLLVYLKKRSMKSRDEI